MAAAWPMASDLGNPVVQAPQRGGEPATGRGQRREAEAGENARLPLIGWVRHDQRVPFDMQLPEFGALLVRAHSRQP